jgi:hypothetical protein
MYAFLNVFFFIFHSALIVFSLSGWLWKKTRVANLVVLSFTGFSWFILGIRYGIGFCPSTEWHWQVRLRLGYNDMPKSYVKFLIDSLTGLDMNAILVDILTLAMFFVALFASVVTNARARRKRGRATC